MPYASDAQRKYLHAKKPDVAAKFDADIRAERAKKRESGKGKKRK